MWSRAELKMQGKLNFKRNYWACVIVSLVLSILIGGASFGGSSAGRSANHSKDTSYTSEYIEGYEEDADHSTFLASIFTGVVIVVILIVALIASVFRILIGNPVVVGGRRFYLENQGAPSRMGLLGYSFQNGRYGNVVLVMFLKNLFTFLWSLLFIIPGIIKSYSYWMMDYLLAENPYLSRQRAFEISKATMQGEKWNTFVLDLSFILWGILSAITCGIVGIFYVAPYADATKAELYAVLREKALSQGIAYSDELPGYGYNDSFQV